MFRLKRSQSKNMEQIEKKQIEYLKKRKEALISGFIDACEEINDQIKDVKSGKWLEEMKEASNEVSD